ncbi:twin-arginine translocation pathway signal protein [Rhodopseudomonas telluris]|uniref:Twin-arginine translocation pathway signal protein n=1 Tax=Rhodopseudomonas telluris TaxID=644215 RepID=A0ABV6ESR7_9BRAD
MQQTDVHPNLFGWLTGRDIVAGLVMAAVALTLTPVIGLLLLLLLG